MQVSLECILLSYCCHTQSKIYILARHPSHRAKKCRPRSSAREVKEEICNSFSKLQRGLILISIINSKNRVKEFPQFPLSTDMLRVNKDIEILQVC